MNDNLISLQQGQKYKGKKLNSGVTKEYFTTQAKCNISQSNTILNDLIAKYKSILTNLQQEEQSYKSRTNNVYLNKNVRFWGNSTSNPYVYAYVTNVGVVKKYPTEVIFNQTAGLNGCSTSAYIDLNMPWTANYDTVGTSIQMPPYNNQQGPVLKSGTPMVAGQSCGFEGSNVTVTQQSDTPSSRYIGCFANPAPYPAATAFYGGSQGQPYTNFIANGDFQLPSSTSTTLGNQTLLPSNSNTLLQSWSTSNSAIIVNSGNTNTTSSATNLIYPTPYPSYSNVCVSLNGTNNITQTINSSLNAGMYTLGFYACGLTNANPINILFNGTSIFSGGNYLKPSLSWQYYQYSYNLASSATSVVITFQGTDTTSPSQMFTALYNIMLTNGTANPVQSTFMSFQGCQQYAQQNNATYFGFQVPSTSTNGLGYCSINTSTNGSFISNLTPATKLVPSLLQASNTTQAPKIGVSAGVTSTGVFVVYTSTGTSSFVPFSTNQPLASPANCYVILNDDGTIKIYSNGTPGSTEKPGTLLWSTSSSASVVPNPNFAAKKGFTGKNWLTSKSLLKPGQFIGSPQGSIYLQMQTDGNLALYTSTYTNACTKTSGGFNQGDLASTALYKLNTATDNLFTYLGKIFFVGADTKLQNYKSTNVALGDNYLKVSNYNNPGTSYNLSGDMSSYNTQNLCKSACTSNNQCYGYSWTSSTNACQLKGSNLSGDMGGPSVSGTDLYVRVQQNSNQNAPNQVNPISSTRKQGYPVGTGTVTDNSSYSYTSSYANTFGNNMDKLREQLGDVQDQINDQLQQMIQCGYNPSIDPTNHFIFHGGNNMPNTIDQIQKQQEMQKQSQIQGQSQNLDNIITDTNSLVNHDSNTYIMWGLGAAAITLLSVGLANI